MLRCRTYINFCYIFHNGYCSRELLTSSAIAQGFRLGFHLHRRHLHTKIKLKLYINKCQTRIRELNTFEPECVIGVSFDRFTSFIPHIDHLTSVSWTKISLLATQSFSVISACQLCLLQALWTIGLNHLNKISHRQQILEIFNI